MIRPLIAAFALLVAAPPAQAATLPATPDTLAAQLKLVLPGDTVALAAGDYRLALKDRAWPADKPITIDARAATGQGWALVRVAGVNLLGGTLRPVCTVGVACYNAALDVQGGADIRANGLMLQGPEAADGYGVRFRASQRVSVTASQFYSFKTALIFDHTDGFQALTSRFSRMRSDGIDVAQSWHGLVEGNAFDGTRITGPEHPDAVQLWSRPDAAPTAHIIVRRNKAFGDTQGFSGFNHQRLNSAGVLVDDGGFDDILIEWNTVVGGFPQGIDLTDARASTIRNNSVETLPGAKYQAKINVVGGSVTTCGNTTGPGAGRKALADPPCGP